MIDEVKQLISKGFKRIFQYANESTTKAVGLVIVFFIFIPPLIIYFQNLFFKWIPYYLIIDAIWLFLKTNVSLKDLILTLLLALEFVCIYILQKEISSTQRIRENFKNTDLNKWNIPKESVWTVEECEEIPGNMLSISNSKFPGTLKDAYSWYDYDLSISVKINVGQDFGIAVRSENNLNCILLKLTKSRSQVFLLYQGTYIEDDQNSNFLPTTIKEGQWVKCRIVLKGDSIEMWISDYKILSYRIPTLVYKVENKYLGTKTTLKEIEESDARIKDNERKDEELHSNYLNLPAGEEKEKAKNEWIQYFIPPNTKVVLEYQNGSMGLFASEGQDKQAFFRNLQIKKI